MQCLHERRARLLGSDTGTNQRRYTFQSKIEVIGVGKTGSIQAHYGRCILIRTRQRHVSETHDFDTFDRTMIKDIVLIPHARKGRIDLLGHVSVYIFPVTGIVHQNTELMIIGFTPIDIPPPEPLFTVVLSTTVQFTTIEESSA